MKNINKAIKYTIEKKKYQIENLESFYSESIKDINDYLNSKAEDIVVAAGLERLASWYFWNYLHDFISKNQLSLANSTFYGIESNIIEFFIGKNFETYDEAVLFPDAIKHMAQALLLGWDDLAVQYGHLLIKMLYAKQYNGWFDVHKHAWFMLRVFCKWQTIELDHAKLNYPENMDIYQNVLENWDTNDKTLLSKLVNNMVEFHIKESDEYEYKNWIPDISNSDYFIYAIEILLWLNIRERMGLLEYEPDNEMMKMPINNWHTQQTEIPKIDLIEKAKAKLLQDYPGIDFELKI